MARLPIITVPDRRLREKCTPVEALTDAHIKLMSDMLETMYVAPGIGLAAPQIGVMERIIVVDITDEHEEPAPLRLVNPEILWRSDTKSIYLEGCLSIPEQFADVERPDRIGLRYMDETGTQQEMEADGLLATVLQHEIDHLDGVLFFDYLSSLKRTMMTRKVQKFVKQQKAEETGVFA